MRNARFSRGGGLPARGSSVIVQGIATDSGKTRVAVIDVSDREAPKLDRMFDVDGQAASSRVVGDDLYLVQQTALQPPSKLYEIAQQELAKLAKSLLGKLGAPLGV